MVKSAISRSSMGESVFEVSATSMIWPMSEETGPMVGLTFGGSCGRSIARRSATCWRLR